MRLKLVPANGWDSFWARTNPGPNPTLRRRIVAVTHGIFYADRMMDYVLDQPHPLLEHVKGWHLPDESVFLESPGLDLNQEIYEVVAIDDSKPLNGFSGRNIVFFGLAKNESRLSEEERAYLLPKRWHELGPDTERFTVPTR